ncbi:MAG: prepilin-type N-terminal cleavage/methylation domain-containing protein [candidate division Zixibacteria bacterium]|nr:prepilin-type N-terminal cleavage/methylation domain-containing protein [candidate division Zixibacteria bacterium]
MKNTKVTNQNGITLLEVMIAMIILSMSLLLLLNMAMVALDGNDWSQNTTQATQLIQEKLEQLRTSAAPTSGSDSSSDFSRSWTVTDVGNHLRQVDVQVVWEDIRQSTKINSMTAFIKTDSI